MNTQEHILQYIKSIFVIWVILISMQIFFSVEHNLKYVGLIGFYLLAKVVHDAHTYKVLLKDMEEK